jgi:hypothetical protein
VLAGTLVLLGGFLFQPPRLAWYDSPVAYGYEVEATGLSGRTYHVPLRRFAPFEQDMSFVFATFQPQGPLAGGYGALAWRGTLDALAAVDTFEQLDALERQGEPTPPGRRAASEALVVRWLERTYHRDRVPVVPIPPPRYVTGRSGPAYEGDEPLRSAEVVLVRSIEDGGSQRFTRQPLLRVEADTGGHAAVSWRVEDGAAP